MKVSASVRWKPRLDAILGQHRRVTSEDGLHGRLTDAI